MFLSPEILLKKINKNKVNKLACGRSKFLWKYIFQKKKYSEESHIVSWHCESLSCVAGLEDSGTLIPAALCLISCSRLFWLKSTEKILSCRFGKEDLTEPWKGLEGHPSCFEKRCVNLWLLFGKPYPSPFPLEWAPKPGVSSSGGGPTSSRWHMLAIDPLGPRPGTLSVPSCPQRWLWGTCWCVQGSWWGTSHAQVLKMAPFRPIMRKPGFSSLPGICKADQPLPGQSYAQGSLEEPHVDVILAPPIPYPHMQPEQSVKVPGGQGQ